MPLPPRPCLARRERLTRRLFARLRLQRWSSDVVRRISSAADEALAETGDSSAADEANKTMHKIERFANATSAGSDKTSKASARESAAFEKVVSRIKEQLGARLRRPSRPRPPAAPSHSGVQVVGACAAGDLTPTSQFSAAHQQISATQSAGTRRTAETAKAQLAEIARARKRHGELRTAHIKTLQNAITSSF